MKKIFFSVLIITGMVCIAQDLHAQKETHAKPPVVSGPVLQTGTENKTPVAPAADTKLHETADKKSSFDGPLPVKGNDAIVPAKVPEQKPLPETNKLGVPNPIKNR